MRDADAAYVERRDKLQARWALPRKTPPAAHPRRFLPALRRFGQIAMLAAMNRAGSAWANGLQPRNESARTRLASMWEAAAN